MTNSSSDEDQTHLRLRIEGFVQAVGYRNYVIAEATRLGVDGWVRNRSDGKVEVLASGPNAAVETLVGLCMKGPPGSSVKDVELHKAEPPAEKGFKRRPSL
ncbi:MAG TPA: acylphosphatase [Rhizomicrobium sp.]|jgi:acylphosphatase|nr:acylphosphatase [Rhizomicrobium sp.]